ncbi:hypothetical protein A3D88_01240 [Candidatus Peribacteria bacterium RIFCSPHIGHO2_02_FULL_52_16]|nr:MAG: hypothetical protein A2706_05965 [Candidatus Peribacteria bacterium RIFCSPHIGHO2_01_FULL_51_35]OGJ61288.1 MAG: hypothetical protein A3D88_01240 [Candidatus Peribacteria bacterium RIFCSPHIGHO2_02_FULL_52_16]
MEQFDLTFTPRKKFKETYRIRTNRLKHWDYTSEGMYFITICTKGKVQWFGEIEDGKMFLSPVGKIAQQFFQDIPKHFSNATVVDFIVMPNHIHGLIHIKDRSFVETCESRVSTNPIRGRPTLRSHSISSMMNQFKSVCTKHIRNLGHKDFHWQSRFHDRLIRSKAELQNVQKYIRENVAHWEEDSEFAHSVQPASV